jgi:hypothetical protein
MEFDRDRPAPGHLTAPESYVYTREGARGRFIALADETVGEVAVRLDDETAGRVGDALAKARGGTYGWATRHHHDPRLPASYAGLDGGKVTVDEADDRHATLELRAGGGVGLAVQLGSGSTFAIASVVWIHDDHERPPDA